MSTPSSKAGSVGFGLYEKHARLHVDKRAAGEAFGVVHYAGLVTYDVDQFLVKNVDQLSGDLSSCVAGSSHERTAALLTWNDAPAAPAPRARGGRGSGGGSKTTVSKKFRGQLASLTTALNATEPHYVRCVKPGAGHGREKAPRSVVFHSFRLILGRAIIPGCFWGERARAERARRSERRTLPR